MIAVKITAICVVGVLALLTVVGIFPAVAETVAILVIGAICILLILLR